MDIFRLELHVPDMKTQVDAQQVREALHSSPGFDLAEIDIPTHMVIVKTANQDAGKDVIFRLSHAGFPPDDTERVTYAEHERAPKERTEFVL